MQSSILAKPLAELPGDESTAFRPNKLFLLIAMLLVPVPDSLTPIAIINTAFIP